MIDCSNNKRCKSSKKVKTVTTSDFILIILFIFIAVATGLCMHNYCFNL